MKLALTLTCAGSVLVCGVLAADAAPTKSRTSSPSRSATKASGKHLLQYKFVMGEVLRYEVRHATNVRTTIDKTTQQVESQSDSVKAWKVTDVLPNGEMEFMHVVESVKMSNQQPGHPANRYDSTRDKTPPRGFEQAARAVGVPLLVIRMAPTGVVTSREEKHPQPPKTADMPITLELPKEPVSVGERWTRAYDVPATKHSGAKFQIRTRRVCRLRQVKGGVASIDVEYQILTPVDAYVRAQLIERLTDGRVRFDVARGRIVEQEHSVDKRVLGFAGEGQASSMHYVARFEERLLDPVVAASPIQRASAQTPAK